jgi:hypothetical protein
LPGHKWENLVPQLPLKKKKKLKQKGLGTWLKWESMPAWQAQGTEKKKAYLEVLPHPCQNGYHQENN